MADINVERKSPGIWPWIIGLIVLALLIWALVAAMDGDDDAEVAVLDPAAEVAEVQPTMPPVEIMTAGVPVLQIMESPATWIGQTVAGEVRVVDVPTDRGFWIEDQGRRLFVILNDRPSDASIDIDAGQTLRINQAMIHDNVSAVSGDVDADTRNIAQGQPVFLTVDEANVEIMQSGA